MPDVPRDGTWGAKKGVKRAWRPEIWDVGSTCRSGGLPVCGKERFRLRQGREMLRSAQEARRQAQAAYRLEQRERKEREAAVLKELKS